MEKEKSICLIRLSQKLQKVFLESKALGTFLLAYRDLSYLDRCIQNVGQILNRRELFQMSFWAVQSASVEPRTDHPELETATFRDSKILLRKGDAKRQISLLRCWLCGHR